MTIDQLEDWLPRLAAISPDQRTALPGVTPGAHVSDRRWRLGDRRDHEGA